MQFLEHSLGHKSYSNFSRQGVIAIGCFQMDVAIPGYKTVKIIGKGGMAKVYLAIQESFDRQAALKIMSPHLTGDPIFGERFLREAKIIASLNHRNIVPVYEVGQHENFHYLSMEYLPGGDLKSRLIKGIRPDEALAVICETASALSYAHSKSYIHRDIKPENILFREDNTSVLTDFGIAKALDTHDANMTSTGMIVGSPHYMSPEQALGKKIDTRSDLYSLGVVLYEVLVGRPLYKADSSVAAAVKHISEPIPKLPDCYACLQEILEKMVAKKPEDRFEALDKEIQRAKRQNTGFGLIWLDIDHFKAINDELGHQAGDDILCRVALWLKAGVRPYDHPGRWGGDEFVVVLSPCDDDTLCQIAARIRETIERDSIRTGTPVTVSVGGYLCQPGDDVDTILRQADQALYRVKQQGRNKVLITDGSGQEINPA